MEAHYCHTQIGWVIIACAVGAAAVIVPQLRPLHVPFRGRRHPRRGGELGGGVLEALLVLGRDVRTLNEGDMT